MFIDETWTATNMTRSHGRCAKGNPVACRSGRLNNAFSVRHSSIALSEKRAGRPGRPQGADSHCISGSNQTSREPRYFSAALYAAQFVVRYFGKAGLGIPAPYISRFNQGIPSATIVQQSPVTTISSSPPAEAEAIYYAAIDNLDMVA